MPATRIEKPVVEAWKSLPYHGYGVCMQPACRTTAHLCGASPQTRVCLPCFEFVYNCRAPRRAS